MTEVDEYLTSKVQPEFRDIVNSLRRLIKTAAPDVREIISYGIPGYKLSKNRLMAVINPSKKHVLLSLNNGLSFEDKYKLLRGVGTRSRHLEFKILADVSDEVVTYYLKQAIRFDRL